MVLQSASHLVCIGLAIKSPLPVGIDPAEYMAELVGQGFSGMRHAFLRRAAAGEGTRRCTCFRCLDDGGVSRKSRRGEGMLPPPWIPWMASRGVGPRVFVLLKRSRRGLRLRRLGGTRLAPHAQFQIDLSHLRSRSFHGRIFSGCGGGGLSLFELSVRCCVW